MTKTQAFKNLKQAIYANRKVRRIKDVKQAFDDYEKVNRPFYVKMRDWWIAFWKK